MLVTVLVLGSVGATAGAGLLAPRPETGEPGWFPPQGAATERPEGPDTGTIQRPPALSEEQQALLQRIRALVGELDEIAGEVLAAAAGESFGEVQAGFLAYISTMGALEQTVHALIATLPGERPAPVRLLSALFGELKEQGESLMAAWLTLPDAWREPVTEAVRVAINSSPNPRFWGILVAVVRGEPDPQRLRERLETARARIQADLETALRRIDTLNRRIADLDERIAHADDPRRLETLQDLRHLAELDLAIQQARVARDEFAIEHIEKQLARLEGSG